MKPYLGGFVSELSTLSRSPQFLFPNPLRPSKKGVGDYFLCLNIVMCCVHNHFTAFLVFSVVIPLIYSTNLFILLCKCQKIRSCIIFFRQIQINSNVTFELVFRKSFQLLLNQIYHHHLCQARRSCSHHFFKLLFLTYICYSFCLGPFNSLNGSRTCTMEYYFCLIQL